jgi:Ca-activated chloride channel family protein
MVSQSYQRDNNDEVVVTKLNQRRRRLLLPKEVMSTKNTKEVLAYVKSSLDNIQNRI